MGRWADEHEDADDAGHGLVAQRRKFGELCGISSRHEFADLLHFGTDGRALLRSRLRKVHPQLAGGIDGELHSFFRRAGGEHLRGREHEIMRGFVRNTGFLPQRGLGLDPIGSGAVNGFDGGCNP